LSIFIGAFYCKLRYFSQNYSCIRNSKCGSHKTFKFYCSTLAVITKYALYQMQNMIMFIYFYDDV